MSSRLTLVTPPGDPDEVERVATGWRLVAAAVAGAADVLRAEPVSFPDIWQGLAATTATDSLTGMAALADGVAQAIGDGALALNSWAAALRRAQETVAAQQVIADDAYEQYTLATSWQAVDTGTDPAGELARVHMQVSWAAGQATDLDAVATRTRQALESSTTVSGLLPPLEPGQSAEDYIASVIGYWSEQIPLLAGHGEDVETFVWALMTAGQALLVGTFVPAYAVQLYRFFQGQEVAARMLPLWLRGVLGMTSGLDPYLGPGSRLGNFLLGPEHARSSSFLRLFQFGYDANRIAGASRWASLAEGVGTLGRGAGWLRGLGTFAAGAGTVLSAANIALQWPPSEAWEAEGAGYAADWAELGFNASLTSMLIVPNPVSAGAVVVTGIAWAGLEIYHNWDDVTAFTGNAYDAAEDVVGWTGDRLEEAGEAVSDFAGGAVDSLGDGARALGGLFS